MKLSDHFSSTEFACRCGRDCGYDGTEIDPLLIHYLETIRTAFDDRPVRITSGDRCPAHNHAVGGAPNSYHMKHMAADFVVDDVPPDLVWGYIETHFSDTLGVGRYLTRTHLDVRQGKARWDKRGASRESLRGIENRLMRGGKI